MCPVLFGATVSATWYVRGTFTSTNWDTSIEMNTTDYKNYTYVLEDYEVASETTYEFKIDNGNWSESYPSSNYQVTIPAGTYDIFFYFNADTHDVKCIYNVELRSSTELLGTFERTGLGTYSLTLDLTNSLNDQWFKPVTYYGTSADWMGVGSFNSGSQLEYPSGMLDVTTDVGDGMGYYYILKNSDKEYKTYTFNVTYDENGWSMTIAGDETRGHQDYTLSFINNSAWTEVACYVWDDSDVPQEAWPGSQMTTKDGTVTIGDNTYDKYTKTFTFYEPYPTKVIFNNNVSVGALQTGDLTLIEGETYSMPVYYICGKAAAFGNWNSSQTTAIMTDDGDGTYSYAQNDVVLGKDFAFKVVKKSYYGSNDPTWYPYNDQTLSVPVDGKYNVVISFDGSKDMNTSETIEGSSATKTYEAVTIGATGWATTVTNSALDFSSLTESFKAYTATWDGTNKKVSLAEVADVQAETGLVLKGTEGTYYAPVAASSETAKGDLKHSSTDTFNVNDDGVEYYCYGLAYADGKAKFAKIKNGEEIPAQKAFLTISKTEAASAQEFSLFFDETTGINLNVNDNLNIDGNAAMYNLAGQKVSNSYKGIVIVNGKKYVNK